MAHSAEVIDLFHEAQKNVVVPASVDGSVRYKITNTSYFYGLLVELPPKILFLMDSHMD